MTELTLQDSDSTQAVLTRLLDSETPAAPDPPALSNQIDLPQIDRRVTIPELAVLFLFSGALGFLFVFMLGG